MDAGVNLLLSVIVLGFLAYIGNYFLQAATTVGEEAAKVAKYQKQQSQNAPSRPRSDGPVFDDTGSGAVSDAQVAAELESRKKKGRGSFQKSADGRAFAPWLDIDEEMVAKNKAAREERKRQGK